MITSKNSISLGRKRKSVECSPPLFLFLWGERACTRQATLIKEQHLSSPKIEMEVTMTYINVDGPTGSHLHNIDWTDLNLKIASIYLPKSNINGMTFMFSYYMFMHACLSPQKKQTSAQPFFCTPFFLHSAMVTLWRIQSKSRHSYVLTLITSLY